MTNSAFKKTVGIIVVLFLFFSQFTGVSWVNPVVAGKNISVYIGYVVVLLSIVLLFCKTLKSIKFDEVMLIMGTFFTVLISIVARNGINNIWNEIYPFIVPLLLYYPIKYSGIKQNTLLNCLLISSFAGAAVSFLISMKIISVETWAAKNDFVRSAGFVDGTLGVVAFCCSLILLTRPKSKIQGVLAFLGLIASSMIIMFGFSRLRVAIAFVMLFIIVFTKVSSKGGIFGRLNLIFIVFVLAVIVLFAFPNIIDTVWRMINMRFSNLGTDGNTSYRVRETLVHIENIVSTMGFGTGWGIRHQMENVFVHNMYSGVVMHCGIVFGFYYIYFLIKTAFNAYKGIKKKDDSVMENTFALIIMLVILCAGFGGAGVTQAGAWFGMAIVYSREEK